MKSEDTRPRGWLQFNIKAVMILTLVVAAYLAGKIPEQRRAIEAEIKAKKMAENAVMAQREAQVMAERAMQQLRLAQRAAQQAQRAQAKSLAKGSDSKDPS